MEGTFRLSSLTFWLQVYQLQTHSHRSRLQWISSLKKAIDNSGEEVDFATNFVSLKLSLYLLVRGRP